jgi:hypothetical protein
VTDSAVYDLESNIMRPSFPASEIEGRENARLVPGSPSFNIKPTYFLHHLLFFTTLEIDLIYLEVAAQQMNLGAIMRGMKELGWIFKRPSMVGAVGVEA